MYGFRRREEIKRKPAAERSLLKEAGDSSQEPADRSSRGNDHFTCSRRRQSHQRCLL